MSVFFRGCSWANTEATKAKQQGAMKAQTHGAMYARTQSATTARTQGAMYAKTQEPQRSGRRQTAAFINHTVAADHQRAVRYMINKNNFKSVASAFIYIRVGPGHIRPRPAML